MFQPFLKIIWSRFLVSRLTVQVYRARQNISTLSIIVYYKTNSFFSDKFFTYALSGLFCSLIKVFEHNFFILKFHCFMLLLSFITSKYSFFRRII